MSKRLIVMGMFNAVYMYLIYPIGKLLEIMCDYLGSVYSLIFLIIYFLPIILNLILYKRIFKNIESCELLEWCSIGGGSVIGSIITIIVLLCISMTNTFQKYTYINCGIPFRLYNVNDLKYFLFVVIYTIFIYELSKKYEVWRESR